MNVGTAAHLADVYAQSLMDLARQSGLVEAVAADFELISTLLAQNPDFEAFLASPYFGEQTKRELVRKTLAGGLQRLTINFLCVVIDHNRGALVPEILGRYRQLYREYQGYQPVEVTVAQPLSDEQVEKLSRELAEAMNRKIDLDVRTDPGILGGMIVRYGDKMVDNSVKGRLTRTIHQLRNPVKRQK